MDIICPKCGEPWDFDSIHERVSELSGEGDSVTFRTVQHDFVKRGCVALGDRCGEGSAHPGVAAVYELLGDDMDGAAAMLDDFGYLGMFD